MLYDGFLARRTPIKVYPGEACAGDDAFPPVLQRAVLDRVQLREAGAGNAVYFTDNGVMPAGYNAGIGADDEHGVRGLGPVQAEKGRGVQQMVISLTASQTAVDENQVSL